MDLLTSMRTYTAVVASGSFTAGAERLGISRALTSKYVGHLEEHLGVRLLNRTTRRLSVTEVGRAYYERCCRLLDELDEVEAAVREQQEVPRGQLKVAAPSSFGEMYLARAVAEYLKEHPNVKVELVLADRFVDIVDEGFDLAVRIGQLADSSLIARRLAPMRILACASPDYLVRAGKPSHPSELAGHNCIIDTNLDDPSLWRFEEEGGPLRVRVDGRFRVNSPLAVREMLLAGEGIGLCPEYAVVEEIRAGRLQPLFTNLVMEQGVYAVYPHGRHLAAKVRTFVDFLAGYFAEQQSGRPGY